MGQVKHFFILNSRGNPLVTRAFEDEPSHKLIEVFFQQAAGDIRVPPVFIHDGVTFISVLYEKLFFVFATEDDMCPTLLLELLNRIATTMADYMGSCSEVTITKNLALAMEIVDEIMCFGTPQHTDSSHLLHLVHNTISTNTTLATQIADKITGRDIDPNVSFGRPLALSLDKRSTYPNEIFVLIKEKLNFACGPQQQLYRSSVIGSIMSKSYLQGSPSCTLMLDQQITVASRSMHRNAMLAYDDIIFSPFVTSTSFDADRTISFVPPDGLAPLCNYRTTRSYNPPFLVTPFFEIRQQKVCTIRVAVQSTYLPEMVANEVLVRFQYPPEASNASVEIPDSVKGSQMSIIHERQRQAVWIIHDFHGKTEFSARFRFIFDDGIPAAPEAVLGPILMDFEVTDLTPSGMNVRGFVVSTQGTSNPPQKWFKFTAVSGNYSISLI